MRLIAVAIAIGVFAVGAASAATPAQYRAKVNGICRGYTPTLKKLDAQMTKAQTMKDTKAFYSALDKLVTLTLAQDVGIEAVPVPSPLKKTMTAILSRLKQVDVHLRRAIADARGGNRSGELSEIFTIAGIAKPLNKQFDAAGLKDCGSNQS